jgi:hypothetical protein
MRVNPHVIIGEENQFSRSGARPRVTRSRQPNFALEQPAKWQDLTKGSYHLVRGIGAVVIDYQ